MASVVKIANILGVYMKAVEKFAEQINDALVNSDPRVPRSSDFKVLRFDMHSKNRSINHLTSHEKETFRNNLTEARQRMVKDDHNER